MYIEFIVKVKERIFLATTASCLATLDFCPSEPKTRSESIVSYF